MVTPEVTKPRDKQTELQIFLLSLINILYIGGCASFLIIKHLPQIVTGVTKLGFKKVVASIHNLREKRK